MPKATEFTEFSGAVADTDFLILLDTSETLARKDKRIAVDHARKQLVRAITSASDPTATDDTSDGYVAGNLWLNTTDGGLFKCEDASAGAAVWEEFGTGMLASDPISINAQTGTSYTLVLGDAGKLVSASNASAITLTVPANSSVAYPVGTVIAVAQLGAGTVTIQGDTGVTVNGTSAGSVELSGQYATASLTQLSNDTWLISGGLASE